MQNIENERKQNGGEFFLSLPVTYTVSVTERITVW